MEPLVLWIAVFGAVMGIWQLCILRGVNYISRPFLCAGYFLAGSVIALFLFRNSVPVFLTRGIGGYSFGLLALFFIVAAALYAAAPLFPQHKTGFKRFPLEFNLSMEPQYLFSKSFDILFQQIMISIMISLLLEAGLSPFRLIVAYIFVFGIIHLPLLWAENYFWGSYYATLAMLSALVFPLIMVNYGAIYSYLIHWIFYLATTFLYLWSPAFVRFAQAQTRD